MERDLLEKLMSDSKAKDYNADNRTMTDKFSDLPPFLQEQIRQNPRMKVFADLLPENPAAKLEDEKDNLDFSDPKIKFLDQLYSIKRTFVFKHDKPSENVNKNTLAEVTAQYNMFNNSKVGEFFKDEKEKEAYMDTVIRWMRQIIEIDRLWTEYEAEIKRACEMSADDVLRELRPSFMEELVDTPWAQFLNKDVPGWPTTWMDGNTIIARQCVPNAGIRIVESLEEATHDLFAYLDSRRQGPSRWRSGLAAIDRNTIVSQGHILSKTVNIGTIPNQPYKKLYENGQGYYKGDLFPMSQMLSRLDKYKSPPGWKAGTVRIRDMRGLRSRKSKNEDINGSKE